MKKFLFTLIAFFLCSLSSQNAHSSALPIQNALSGPTVSSEALKADIARLQTDMNVLNKLHGDLEIQIYATGVEDPAARKKYDDFTKLNRYELEKHIQSLGGKS